MKNLVSRLRTLANLPSSDYFERGPDGATCDQAADEIERLRAFEQAVLGPENQPSQFGTVLTG